MTLGSRNVRAGKARGVGLLVGASVGALIAIASGGCTITTSDKPIDFDSGLYAPQPDSGAPALGCSECLFQGCRPQWAVCQNDTDCRAIYECSTVPGVDQAGVTACFCAHPTGQDKYSALAACDQVAQCGTCQSNCSATPANCSSPGVFQAVACPAVMSDAGTVMDSGPPTEATDAATVTDCASCTSMKCSAQTMACAASSECDQFTLCTAGCHDSACFDKCGTDHASGKQASADLNTCTTSNCSAACGL